MALSLSRQDTTDLFLGLNEGEVAQLKSSRNIDAVTTVVIPSTIPEGTKNLTVVLGSDFDNEDQKALAPILDDMRRACPCLKSVCIEMHIDAWTSDRGTAISGFQSLPLERFQFRLVEPVRGYKMDIIEKNSNRRVRTLARFPVDDFLDVFNSQNAGLWTNLQELTLVPNQGLSSLTMLNIVAGWTFIAQLYNLRKIALPMEFRGYLNEILRSLSAMPEFRSFTLFPPFTSLSKKTHRSIVKELLEGLDGFHHLQQVTLPLDLLSNRLVSRLAGIADLQKLTFSPATSQIQQVSRLAAIGDFPSLRCFKMSGSLSDFANIISACVHPGTSVLEKVSIKVNSLGYAGEMRESLQVLADRSGMLKKFRMTILDVHRMENAHWMDLTSLWTCSKLEQFIVTHPRPLPITDADVLHLFRHWPHARYISLNPRPSLPAWRVTTTSPYRIPTLACLGHLINEGQRLRHFGVYLNTSLETTVSGLVNTKLTELDLGMSYRKKASMKLILSQFPNATIM